MKHTEIEIASARKLVDIADVIRLGVVLHPRVGGGLNGCCPFCGEPETKELQVSTKNQVFYCFGCGAGGNVFSYVMKLFNFSFDAAVDVVIHWGLNGVKEIKGVTTHE